MIVYVDILFRSELFSFILIFFGLGLRLFFIIVIIFFIFIMLVFNFYFCVNLSRPISLSPLQTQLQKKMPNPRLIAHHRETPLTLAQHPTACSPLSRPDPCHRPTSLANHQLTNAPNQHAYQPYKSLSPIPIYCPNPIQPPIAIRTNDPAFTCPLELSYPLPMPPSH